MRPCGSRNAVWVITSLNEASREPIIVESALPDCARGFQNPPKKSQGKNLVGGTFEFKSKRFDEVVSQGINVPQFKQLTACDCLLWTPDVPSAASLS